VKPASISYGSGAFVSSGGTAANTDSDFKLMLGSLSDAGSTLEYGAWVMAPKAAIYLAGLRDTSGALAYPQVNARGGMLMGLPVLTTAGVPVTGSPPSSTITLLDPSQVLVADDGGGSIQVAESAAVQMSDSPAEGAQHLVSLFQTNSVALKLSRHANWRAARPGMARVLTDFSV
jgi:HK97 family phage major capsid protein